MGLFNSLLKLVGLAGDARRGALEKYYGSSTTAVDGYGTKGQKYRPWNYGVAIEHFNHWAYAAAKLNADAVANVQLRLYARNQPGREKLYRTRAVSRRTQASLLGQLESKACPAVVAKVATFAGEIMEVVEPHPALSLLQTVNPNQNGYELTALRMIDLQATGNSYLYVADDRMDIPAQILRMPPHWTEIIPSKPPAATLIDGYVYGKGRDVEKKFDADEVIHFRLPHPGNLHYGKGWFESAWTALTLHQSKREMDVAKFDNMARPDWLLNVPGLDKDGVDEFRQSVENELRGRQKKGKFLITGGADMKAIPLQFEVDEIGTPTRVIEEISAVSGVPVAMLLSNDPTRASSEAARLGWYRNTIRPYCRLDEEKLNEQWLPRFPGSEDLVLAYDHVTFEDELAQSKRLIGLVAGGLITQNEGRAELGYADHEDGDTLHMPAGNTGGAAGTGGDQMPGQNNDRQND